MRLNLLWAAIALLVPFSAYADEDKFVREYLATLQASETPVFYSACTVDGSQAVVLFGIGKAKGLFLEIVGGRVANSANVWFAKGYWHLDESLGGIYTINRVGHLVDQLVREPFEVLLPKELSGLRTRRARRTCTDYK